MYIYAYLRYSIKRGKADSLSKWSAQSHHVSNERGEGMTHRSEISK